MALLAAGGLVVLRAPLSRRASLATLLMLAALIIGEFMITDLTIVAARQEL